MNTPEPKRVLFHAPPLMGHAIPMLPLARAMREQGHTVAWAVAGDAQAPLLAQGFECHAVGPDRPWAVAELNRQWPERATLPRMQAVLELGPRLFGGVYPPATLPDLLQLLRGWQPDLLVHDVMAHAAPLAAELSGLRSVSHGFGLPRPRDSIEGAAQRTAPLWQAHGLALPPDSGNHRHGHVDVCPPSMRGDEPVPAGPRWPLSPTSAVRRRLGPRQGVVTSFGTVHQNQGTFDHLLEVLLQGPWPVRAALGRPLDPARHWPAHVHAASWLDLTREWQHARVGACHAGAGTLFGALAQGVPLLVLPVAADQFRNARALLATGAGLVLEGEQATAAAIREALQRLHDEPAFTQAAERMADELAAMPKAHAVAQAVVRALFA